MLTERAKRNLAEGSCLRCDVFLSDKEKEEGRICFHCRSILAQTHHNAGLAQFKRAVSGGTEP